MSILKNKMGKIGAGVLALGLAGTVAGAVMLPVSANMKKTITNGGQSASYGTGWVNWLQLYDANGKPTMNKEELKEEQKEMLEETEVNSKSEFIKVTIKMFNDMINSKDTPEGVKEEFKQQIKLYKSMQSNDITKIAGIIMLAIGGAALLAGAGVMFYSTKSKNE
ncbi:MAG: hypothetical protein ACRC4M_01585 [Mycoplasma sp.]